MGFNGEVVRLWPFLFHPFAAAAHFILFISLKVTYLYFIIFFLTPLFCAWAIGKINCAQIE